MLSAQQVYKFADVCSVPPSDVLEAFHMEIWTRTLHGVPDTYFLEVWTRLPSGTLDPSSTFESE